MSGIETKIIPPDPPSEQGRAAGIMEGIIQLHPPGGIPTIPIVFETKVLKRTTTNGTLNAFAYINSPDPSIRYVIGFSFRSKDAPTGTYFVPGDQVIVLSYWEYKDFQYIEHPAVRGTIELKNDQPVERIGGSLSFDTMRDGATHGYTVRVNKFDIRGIDPI